MKAPHIASGILAVFAGLTLAACSQPAKNEGSAAVGAETSPQAQVAPVECPKTVSGYNPFPGKLVIPFDYHLRSDRIYKHKAGAVRRRVTIEYLDTQKDQVASSLRRSLADAGFVERKPGNAQSDNADTLVLTKHGMGTVYVKLNEGGGTNPSNPDALGTVSLDYPYDGKP